MERFLKIIIKKTELPVKIMGEIAMFFTLSLVFLVGLHVASRYFFEYNPAWMMELEWHLFALIFLLGSGYAFKEDKHVRVDLFYSRFSNRDKAWTNFIGTLVFLIPWTIFIIIYAFNYALDSYQLNEGSPDPGGLPWRFVIKFSIVLGMFILFLQGLNLLAKSSLELFFKNTEWK